MAAEDEKTFVLCVHLKFACVEERIEFENAWRPLAEFVLKEEKGTLSYELMVADTDNDACKVLVFERYISKAYFNDVHRTSQPYLAFEEQQQQWRIAKHVEVSGQSYYETGLGHMER